MAESTAAAVGSCVPKDISQGREYCPHTQHLFKNIFMFSNRKELRRELLTHWQEPSWFCYDRWSPGTRGCMDCDGVICGESKCRSNPGLGIERHFWASYTLLGPSPVFFFCLVWWGSSDSTDSRAGERGQVGQVGKGELSRKRKGV